MNGAVLYSPFTLNPNEEDLSKDLPWLMMIASAERIARPLAPGGLKVANDTPRDLA